MSGGSRMQPKRLARNGGSSNKMTSKLYWSREEDTNLITGWLQYNADKRDGGTNWEKLAAYVNEKSPNQPAPRTGISCKGRWNYVSASVRKFIGAMTEAQKTATGDMSETDIWDLAEKLYWEDTKSSFCFARAYELLHAAPRFLEVYCTKQRKTGAFDRSGARQGNEGSSKRVKLNEEEDYDYSSEDSGAPKLGDYATPPRSREGIPNEQLLLKDRDWKNSHLFGEDWKEVKLLEIQANKEIEQWKLEFEREKEANQTRQNDLDRKCKILEKLLDKQSLSPTEEALKSKLLEELC